MSRTPSPAVWVTFLSSTVNRIFFYQKQKRYKQEVSRLKDTLQVLEAKEEQLKLEKDTVK